MEGVSGASDIVWDPLWSTGMPRGGAEDPFPGRSQARPILVVARIGVLRTLGEGQAFCGTAANRNGACEDGLCSGGGAATTRGEERGSWNHWGTVREPPTAGLTKRSLLVGSLCV
ncbi:hypothetical protein NDU88_000681 [Pleurodeles waltl]|uniref:Uncharacterized protein n=1 Tax=Pleurodeles waltl TaxID=8319 RepID=A0AAV7UQN3_PLEWA|nr:hypothetical protein NDU88_000681 [Pleurodeles waltl]